MAPPLPNEVPTPGTVEAESTRVLGGFLRDVMKLNLESKNFRVFGPDETASNRLDALYEVTPKEWLEPILPVDEDLSPDGRVLATENADDSVTLWEVASGKERARLSQRRQMSREAASEDRAMNSYSRSTCALPPENRRSSLSLSQPSVKFPAAVPRNTSRVSWDAPGRSRSC